MCVGKFFLRASIRVQFQGVIFKNGVIFFYFSNWQSEYVQWKSWKYHHEAGFSVIKCYKCWIFLNVYFFLKYNKLQKAQKCNLKTVILWAALVSRFCKCLLWLFCFWQFVSKKFQSVGVALPAELVFIYILAILVPVWLFLILYKS